MRGVKVVLYATSPDAISTAREDQTGPDCKKYYKTPEKVEVGGMCGPGGKGGDGIINPSQYNH